MESILVLHKQKLQFNISYLLPASKDPLQSIREYLLILLENWISTSTTKFINPYFKS